MKVTYIQRLFRDKQIIAYSAFCFSFLLLLILFPICIELRKAQAEPEPNTTTEISIETEQSNAIVNIVVNSEDGTFVKSSDDNSVTFGVTTNNDSGYTLSVVAADDDGKMLTQEDNVLYTIGEAIDTETFSNPENTEYNGFWGYMPSKFNSSVNSYFLPSPTTAGDIIDVTSIMAAETVEYTIALGARADATTETGSYAKSLALTAVANTPTGYRIEYNSNAGADAVSNMPTPNPQSGTYETSGDTIAILSSNTPTRNGYTFDGWCETNVSPCAGTLYQPGSNYLVDPSSTANIALYASWTEMVTYPTIQSLTVSSIATLLPNAGDTAYVTDSRDGEVYEIGKLVDGNYWMLENLRLGSDASQLNFSNTNVAEGYTYSMSAIASNSVGSATRAAYNASSENEEMTYGTQGNTAKIGIYYNYCAATAGTYCMDWDYESDEYDEPDAEFDICPTGWSLPSGNNVSSLSYDYDDYQAGFMEAFRPLLAGYNYSGSSISQKNSYGHFWMRDNNMTGGGGAYQVGDNSAYYSEDSRGYAVNVRCIFRNQKTLENPVSYSITFDKNTTDEVANLPAATNGHTFVSTIKIPSGSPTRHGYQFKGWCTIVVSDNANCSGTSVQPGNSYNYGNNPDVTLYAVWKAATYMVSYDANYGTGAVSDQLIMNAGNSVSLQNNGFTRSGYYFKGWGTDRNTVAYRVGENITPSESMTLYAIWGQSNTSLYDAVASLSKGSSYSINTAVTRANSGVYQYTGDHSDENNNYNVYFYRGILDVSNYGFGASGDSMNYPNYVKLANDTCWRIIRTTGSGGIKLIYNGEFGATYAGSCANKIEPYNYYESSGLDYSTNYNETRINDNLASVGYTYNSSAASITDQNTILNVEDIFGSDNNIEFNNTRSEAKKYLEDQFYTTYMTEYTSMLEAGAGYCNDRNLYSSAFEPLASTKIYDERVKKYSGAYARNYQNNIATLTLKCGGQNNTRSVVDLYRYDANNNDGLGNRLKYPVAMITSEEAILAGLRYGAGDSNSKDIYLVLRNSEEALTMSPFGSWSNGAAEMISYTDRSSDAYTYGDRMILPVVSLNHSATLTGGSGTATNPWTIE